MKAFWSFCLFLIVILNAQNAFADTVKPTITLAIGAFIPPYAIQENNSGIEHDIIKEAFKRNNQEVKFIFLPNKRGIEHYRAGLVDGVVNVKPLMLENGYLSDVVIDFKNVVTSLYHFSGDIYSQSDLRPYNILSYQTASISLGSEFRANVSEFHGYKETADQSQQVIQLVNGTADLIISDLYITEWYLKRLIELEKVPPTTVLKHYHILSDNKYRIVFRNVTNRDIFDANLRKMREDGTYEAIYDRYISEFK